MRTTKTEDLIKFGSRKKEDTYYVSFYKDGAFLRSTAFQGKSRADLKKRIKGFIEITWPADKDKISYQVR